MAITKNIVSDYGADNSGVADVGPAFYTDLKADMAGEDCNLTVPPGDYSFQSRPGGFFWATGMTSLDVTATGSTWLESGTSAPVLGTFHMTQIGIDAASGKSARVQTVSAGATSVALDAASSAAGHISRATVGNWMLVAGYDTQGLFQAAYGFPSNAHFFDFVQITAVDTDNNIISFTPALTESYRSDWPEFNRGNNFEVDSGGPATVYFLAAGWEAPKEFNGGTYQNTNLIHCEGKDFTIRNGDHALGGLPIYPSVNKNWSAINFDVSGAGTMELDKFVETFTFDGGASHQFHNQSSSVKNCILRNTTMDASVNGSGRNTIIENCVIGGNLAVGCDGYGRADTFVCRNTSIAGEISAATVRDTAPVAGGITEAWSMSNGLITIPMSYDSSQGRLFVPDPHGRNVLFWRANSGRIIGSFQVLSVTGDRWPAVDNQSATTNITSTNTSKTITVSSDLFTSGDIGKVILIQGASSAGAASSLKTFIKGVSAFNGSTQDITVYHPASRSQSAVSGTVQWGTCNMYVQTNQSGGLPDSSLWIGGGSGVLHCEQPAARTVYFENVTGSATALDLSQEAARNRPLWSYTKRTYDGTERGTTAPTVNIIGSVVSIKVNVITPYTGTRPVLNVGFTQFDNMSVVTNGSLANYGPRFNLKVAGERVITPAGVTGTQSGDTNLSLGGATFLPNAYAARVSHDITGESASVYPLYTIEIITDQGFSTGPVAVAPLRLRLRAA